MGKDFPTKALWEKRPPGPGGTTTSPTLDTDGSTDPEEGSQSALSPKKRQNRKPKPASKPQYYNADPVARMFGRANETPVEVNRVPTTCLVDT